jgi:hypothetical protein
MGRVQRRWRAALVVAGAAFSSVCGAQAQTEAVAVDFRAFAGCPDEAAFFAELAARSPRIRRRASGEPGWTVSVVLERSASAVAGRLALVRSDGSQAAREITGSLCTEVASALALIAALMIDPRASAGEPVSPAPEPAPVPDAEPPPAGAEPAPAPAVPVAPPSPPPSPPPVGEDRPAPAPREPPSLPGVAWVAGAEAHGMFGAAPSAAFGGGGFVALEDRNRGPFAVAARLGLFAVTTFDAFDGGVGGRFTWIVARPEVCLLRPVLGDGLRLESCALFDAGVLRSAGSGLHRPDVSLDAWLAAGALARLSWVLPARLLVAAGGGAQLPFYRYAFRYGSGSPQGDVQVYEVPAVTGVATLGVGYRFQ